jgi:hypothetical protein
VQKIIYLIQWSGNWTSLGQKSKIDIRCWPADHHYPTVIGKTGQGITLDKAEATTVVQYITRALEQNVLGQQSVPTEILKKFPKVTLMEKGHGNVNKYVYLINKNNSYVVEISNYLLDGTQLQSITLNKKEAKGAKQYIVRNLDKIWQR